MTGSLSLPINWRSISMDFIALDVETANADLSSICQIGIANFSGGAWRDSWNSLVNPEDEFDPVNVSVHGISSDAVADAPTFLELRTIIEQRLASQTVAIHSTFDRSALIAVFAKHGLTPPPVIWVDTARVARRAWPDVARSGYGLASLAERFGLRFRHHDAAEDARAAGEILLQAVRATGVSVSEWTVRASRPIGASENGESSTRIARDGNTEGPLFGEVAVFTGALTMPRRQAADMAAAAGCKVASDVSKSTTLLIVGDQDVRRLNGQVKSTKHRSAERLIEAGHIIRVLRESDFVRMLSAHD